MKLKVKDVGNYGCSSLFRDRGYDLVRSVDEADIVVLNGGEDIATEIYNQRHIKQYVFNSEGQVALEETPSFVSPRDKMEMIIYNQAKAQGKFVFGVCRGAQLINCMEGGTLWQHVNNHGYTHQIVDVKTGAVYRSTSVHHQQMRVPECGEIIAVANESTFKIDANQQEKVKTFDKRPEDGTDPEIVWFPKSRALCVQGHPEYAPQSAFADYCFELIDHLRVHGMWPSKATSRMASV